MKTPKRTLAAPAFAAWILVATAGLAHANPAGLEVGAQVGAASCWAGLALVEIDVAVIAGSAAPVTFHVSIGGGAFTNAGTSRNWTSHGSTKTMEETLVVHRPANGLGAQVWICAAQPGSKGNASRSACTAVMVPGVLCGGGPGGPS